MGASNRRFTVSGPLHHEPVHVHITCFLSGCVHLLTSRRKVKFTRVRCWFLPVYGKLRMSDRVQLIAWHGIQQHIIWIFCRESEVSG